MSTQDWNTCPKCKNEVDVNDAADGSEVRCLGCRTVLVVVEDDGEDHARVTDEELSAILRGVEADGNGYCFHRIQEGYPDNVPRAVFVHPDEEPVGVPIPEAIEPIMSLVQRLAMDLRVARDVLIMAAFGTDIPQASSGKSTSEDGT
jgi:hypothetical protein